MTLLPAEALFFSCRPGKPGPKYLLISFLCQPFAPNLRLSNSNMKKALLFLIIIASVSPLFAQKVDSIYFHLYTDSLKKGQHNYINVDGKLTNGRWQPLTDKEVEFTSSAGSFEGNELVITFDFKPEKVTVKAVLKSNPSVWKETTIWIKKLPDPQLPTRDDIMNNPTRKSRRN
jgi:hypothetical protein